MGSGRDLRLRKPDSYRSYQAWKRLAMKGAVEMPMAMPQVCWTRAGPYANEGGAQEGRCSGEGGRMVGFPDRVGSEVADLERKASDELRTGWVGWRGRVSGTTMKE